MYTQRSLVETQPPTHWHRVQLYRSAVCVIAQQYPSLTFISLRFCYPQGRIRGAFQNFCYNFFTCLKIARLKLRNLKLRKSGVIALPKGTDKLASPLVPPNIEVGRFVFMKVIEFLTLVSEIL